jgi:hypothetical protein
MLEQHAARPSSLKRASAVLAGIAVLFLAWTQREWLAGRADSALPDPNYTRVGPETYVRNTDTVIVAVRQLARLESVTFHMEKVIDIKDEGQRAFGMLKTHDALLLVAAGDVVGGVDLTKLQAEDISVDLEKHTVRMRVPPAEVLSVSLNEQRTYVYARQTTLLTKPARDLESRARQQAASAIRDAALQAGILERAHQTTTQTLRALLLSLGYEVTFTDHE